MPRNFLDIELLDIDWKTAKLNSSHWTGRAPLRWLNKGNLVKISHSLNLEHYRLIMKVLTALFFQLFFTLQSSAEVEKKSNIGSIFIYLPLCSCVTWGLISATVCWGGKKYCISLSASSSESLPNNWLIGKPSIANCAHKLWKRSKSKTVIT